MLSLVRSPAGSFNASFAQRNDIAFDKATDQSAAQGSSPLSVASGSNAILVKKGDLYT